VRRVKVRSVAHSACQAPSERSSTLVAAAVCRVAASGPAVSAARRISTERTGLFFCGIVEDLPPSPSASSPISGRLPVATSVAIWPQASQQVTSASPMRVTVERVVCHGGAGANRSAAASRSLRAIAPSTDPASSVAAARVPAAPPTCTGSDGPSPANGSAASSTPDSQRAAFTPTVLGSAACVSVRASIGVSRWVSASPDSVCTWLVSSPPMRASASRVHSISAVSITSWLVKPRCNQRAACAGRRARSNALRPLTGLPSPSAPAAIVSASPVARCSPTSARACVGAIPALMSPSSHACSTATIAARNAPSLISSPAR
jgi:hypothetical protein